MSRNNDVHETIVQMSGDFMARHMPDGRFLFASPAAERLLGYTPEELLETSIYDHYHPDDLTKTSSNLDSQRNSNGISTSQHRLRCKSGEYIWVETRSRNVHDKLTGDLVEFVTVTHDITRRKSQEEKTIRRAAFSQALLAAQSPQDVCAAILAYAPAIEGAAVVVSTVADNQATIIQDYRDMNSELNLTSSLSPGWRLTPAHAESVKRPYIIDSLLDQSQQAAGWRALAYTTGARSLMSVPLLSRGQWLGDILILSGRVALFDEQVLSDYRAVAEQAGPALQAALLSAEIRESLERRGRQVALSTRVAQEFAAASSLEDLYDTVVKHVKEQFGYYHVQLLRYDPAQDAMKLIVGYGEIGNKMLSQQHAMPIGEGLIGYTAVSGKSVLRSDVTQDPNWRPNPLLPLTRCELAVPIKLGQQVLGVLDVQGSEVGELTEDDQLLLEGLCGQIAVAIESTRLRQEMSQRLDELGRLQRKMSREGWQRFIGRSANGSNGFFYRNEDVEALSGEVAIAGNGRRRAFPLAVRGQVIGELGIEVREDRPLTSGDRELLVAVSSQVADALEAARLFEQTQEALARQERLTGELETVAQVSINSTTILDEERLLQSVVDLTKERFGFYHAHIYTLDEPGSRLKLHAGAGEIGRIMTAEGHSIPMEADSLVARAARDKMGFYVNNTASATDFLPNPLLPATKAELAVPLVIADTLLGVLDVQADEVDFFTEKDLLIQQTLAAQIAVALQNAKLYSEQLQVADKLREVDRLKSEFLASMSHELRTPLNSIIGFAEVLLEGLDGELNPRMEEDVSLIRDSGQHLRQLIGNILDMSKIEAGMMNLRLEPIDLPRFMDEVVATAGVLAREKGLDLESSVDPDISTVQADRTRLMQVMLNLVGNAIKFTEEGKVSVEVLALQSGVEIRVTDTGAGIEDEHMPIIFEQFRQIDGSLSRKHSGTGLGLPVSKRLVELHGGDIGVTSKPSEGSTFWFTIPDQAEAATT